MSKTSEKHRYFMCSHCTVKHVRSDNFRRRHETPQHLALPCDCNQCQMRTVTKTKVITKNRENHCKQFFKYGAHSGPPFDSNLSNAYYPWMETGPSFDSSTPSFGMCPQNAQASNFSGVAFGFMGYPSSCPLPQPMWQPLPMNESAMCSSTRPNTLARGIT